MSMVRKRTSIFKKLGGGAVALTASLVLVTLVLQGCWVQRAAGRAELRALQAVAEVGAAELLDRVGENEPGDGISDAFYEAFERWSWATLRQPQVLATALRDKDGRVRRLVPPDMTIDAALDSMPPGGTFGLPCEVDVFGERTRTWVASAPLVRPDQPAGAGSVVILASRSSLSGTWHTWAFTFALPLIGIGVIAVAIGLRWIRARLATPLRMMVRRADEDESQWRTRLPIHRDDELGAISRTIEEIIGESSDARAQLDQLRRGLHLRVAERTRGINRMLRDAQRKVWLDPLTQLGNRRLLDDRLDELFDAQRASGGRLSVAMFDVDHFKAHNDTHGHAAGDDLLRFLGQLLRGSVRETDVAVRYAGDEFVLLLPDVGPEDALALTERIVRFFAQQTSVFEEKPRPTLSAGVAAMPDCNATTGGELLAQADDALYQAKARGKNTVCLAVLGATAALNPDKSAGLAWRTNPHAG